MMRNSNKAYDFCKKSVGLKTTPKYVKLQMKDFIKICEGKDKKYIISNKKLNQLENVLKLLIMPKGLKAGKSLYECTTGYQWLFYTAILCTVYKDNQNKRRYETGVLEICRKNFKTYTIATIFILLFLTEPQFSKFYSVAPDGSLSREIREAISETIRSSPLIYEYKNKKRFKLLRDYIKFIPTQTVYSPLSYSTSRMDGKLPNVFCADEVGALPNSYPIHAMRSGQLNILNKLGFIISTMYPTMNNPFMDEVDYSKKVLDGIEKDESRFSLLYEPDKTKGWETDDLILQQANPVALEIKEIWEDLIKKRAYAIAVENARENFVTKHCNIIYQGVGTESFVDVNELINCRVSKIDWTGRNVYLGVDLAMTNDNCAVAMVSEEDNEILADVIAFIPEGRIEEKNKYEKIDYNKFIKTMKCIACGDRTVDYGVIEDFVFSIEEKYNVNVISIGYDRYNALSSAQKWDKKYNTVQIRQHSDTLHSPTKLLYEKILNRNFRYEENPLLEINFENARCTYDTNMNRYITKKRSRGKVDMVVALINAVYLLQQDVFLENDDFFVQVIE